MRVLRAPRLTSKSEVRRGHERELRDLIREVESLQQRVESEWLEIDEDYPDGVAAQACDRMKEAAALLGRTWWLLRGVKRGLP